jgi:hypothetical protein
MVQNVRGQTLIDAIVQVFQEAPGARPLTAGEVARQLRERGFWGGKEPKAPEQVVDSYLATRHAGMFEPGANGTFALKPVYFRPAARSAALASALATAATRAEPAPTRNGAAIKPTAAAPARPAPHDARAKAEAPKPKKKRKLFGKASVAYVTPAELEEDSNLRVIDVHLSFEEAMKLHLGLGQMLAKLNGAYEAGEAMAAIRVHVAKRRVALYPHRRKRPDAQNRSVLPKPADWGVEPG